MGAFNRFRNGVKSLGKFIFRLKSKTASAARSLLKKKRAREQTGINAQIRERINKLKLDPVVKENLMAMLGVQDGGMRALLMQESFGGYAGFYKGRSATGANFYCDENGKIILFGNLQNVPPEIRNRYKKATFRVTSEYRIVGIYGELPEQAKHKIIETMAAYNMHYSEIMQPKK